MKEDRIKSRKAQLEQDIFNFALRKFNGGNVNNFNPYDLQKALLENTGDPTVIIIFILKF